MVNETNGLSPDGPDRKSGFLEGQIEAILSAMSLWLKTAGETK